MSEFFKSLIDSQEHNGALNFLFKKLEIQLRKHV
jgi:hypothetical protein